MCKMSGEIVRFLKRKEVESRRGSIRIIEDLKKDNEWQDLLHKYRGSIKMKKFGF